MSNDYDVVVVGARAAGASTAMLLARFGHRVALLDRSAMPSDTISTHALLRPGVLQLERWGLLAQLERAGTPPVSSLTLGFGDDRVRTQLRAEHGVAHLYAPRRFVLDAMLVEAAAGTGVEVMDQTSVIDVVRSGDRVGGVIAHRRGARPRTITASVVIGADGVHSRIAQAVGAEVVRTHAATNTVHYAYYSGVDHPGFWFQFTPGVNAGLITTNDGLTCVFAGRQASRLADWGGDPQREFLALFHEAGCDLAEQVAAGRRETRFRGTSGLAGHIRRAWGPGWALVGDAGCTIDPISAHGISSALRDAELGALAVDRVLRHPQCEREAMSRFERERDRLSMPIFDAAKALASYAWSADEASILMRSISDATRQECDLLASLPAPSATARTDVGPLTH
jgi:2-polyprenyl-6-methoxyphenol hydroxylase-like FAD-dependent oxidoreductase